MDFSHSCSDLDLWVKVRIKSWFKDNSGVRYHNSGGSSKIVWPGQVFSWCLVTLTIHKKMSRLWHTLPTQKQLCMWSYGLNTDFSYGSVMPLNSNMRQWMRSCHTLVAKHKINQDKYFQPTHEFRPCVFSNLASRYDIGSRWLHIGVTDNCVKYPNPTFYFGHILAMTVQCYLGSMSRHPLVMDNWISRVDGLEKMYTADGNIAISPDHMYSLWIKTQIQIVSNHQSLFKGNTLTQGQFSSGVDDHQDQVQWHDLNARFHCHNEFANL